MMARPAWMALLLAAAASPAAAQTGAPTPAPAALVIGNSEYAALPPLPTCAASAQIVAAGLKRAGFQVTLRSDLSNGEMGGAIVGFAGTLAKAPPPAAVVYVCGYVVGYDGRPFLLPVSASIERDTDALTQGMVAKSVVDAWARSGVRAGLVLLDAVAKPASEGPLGLAALAAAAPPVPGQGFAAASLTPPLPQGPSVLASAFAAGLGAPKIELGAMLAALAGRVSAAGGKLALRMPAEPAFLVGGPVPAVVAAIPPPRPAPPPAPAVAPPPPAPAVAPAAAPPPAPPPPPPPPPPPIVVPDEAHMTEQDRRAIQTALSRLGYYDGAVDGVFGPDTRAAIRRFQHELGAEMNGHIAPAQASRLLAGKH